MLGVVGSDIIAAGEWMTFNGAQQQMTGARVVPRNMGRLLLMRTVLIFCQLLLVMVSLFYDGITLPLPEMMVVIMLYIAVNVLSLVFLLRNRGLNERVYFGQLLADVIFLTLLLYFSGGYTNPFISLYLLPLIVVSTTLGRQQALVMAALILACYTLLVFNYWPLFTMGMASVQTSGFHLHLLGMWFSFALSVGLIVFFIMRMTRSIRQRDIRLSEMREQAERDSHVLALGAMAAGAAHELGTPLSTIAVVVHELECDFAGQPEVTGQTAILKAELARCKQVLSQLSFTAGHLRAEGGRRLGFDAYINDVATQWKLLRPQIELRLSPPSVNDSSPQLVADITLTQVLFNLLNNAADASGQSIELGYGWDADSLWLEVRDGGPGFSQRILKNTGQPEISTKSNGRGLGLFLSRAVVDRLGGQLLLSNAEDGGACARITLPRSEF